MEDDWAKCIAMVGNKSSSYEDTSQLYARGLPTTAGHLLPVSALLNTLVFVPRGVSPRCAARAGDGEELKQLPVGAAVDECRRPLSLSLICSSMRILEPHLQDSSVDGPELPRGVDCCSVCNHARSPDVRVVIPCDT